MSTVGRDIPGAQPASPARSILLQLDAQGRVQQWSSALESATGYSAGALASRSIERLFEPAHGERWTDLFARTQARGRLECEGALRGADGERLAARLLLDAVGGGAYLANIVLHEGAAAADKPPAADVPHEAVERLAAGMAHRFNNVLAAILGSLEVLCHRLPTSQRAAGPVDTALRAAARGSLLTHHLLSYAQIQQLTPKPVDVREILRRAADAITAGNPPNIVVTVDVEGDVPPLVIDAEELVGALAHLGENSREAMPAGGEIRLSAHRVRQEGAEAGRGAGDYVRITVSDKGHGIDATIRPHVAEPFFTTRGVAEHLGMGLSTVQGFVAQSRGQLQIDSRVGHGTDVTLWLPLGSADRAADSDDPEFGKDDSRPATVLLVDDDELVLLSTSGLLQELGWNVLAANGGPEALRLIEAHPEIDVVLTDQVMPGMTGLELAHAIRYAHPQLPVVLTSGGEMRGGDIDSAGSVRRLVKPYGADELSAALRRAAH